jgi:hypothetical protein
MANPVAKANMAIYKNSVYTHRFNINDSADSPVDLTGYSAKLDMRAETATDPALYQATELDDLAVNPAGYVVLTIPATAIEAWEFDSAQYDLVIQPGGVADDSICVVRGTVTVYPSITDI